MSHVKGSDLDDLSGTQTPQITQPPLNIFNVLASHQTQEMTQDCVRGFGEERLL